jgi:hypothetical protein
VQINAQGLPQWADTRIALTGGNLAANGLLATVTIDTTGFTTGTWPLKIANTISGSWVGALYTMFAYAGATLVDGSITIEEGEGLLGGGGGGGESMMAMMGGEALGGETAAPANMLILDLPAGVEAALLTEEDFEFFTSADREKWGASDLQVAISLSQGTGEGGRDQIVIRFLSPPPLEEPYFRVRIGPNELANHHETTTLDFDLRTWERL